MKNKQLNLEKIINLAYKYLGRTYKYGATLSEAPKFFDCSSFVQFLFKKLDINIGRPALAQASHGRVVKDKKKIMPGDLIFIKGAWGHYNPEFPQGIGHVLLYIGNGKVIHAKGNEVNGRQKGKVILDTAAKWLKRHDLIVIKRII